MILYLDTSALVKLYVNEPGADAVRQTAEKAGLHATHQLTYVEARSAFARRWRDGHWPEVGYRRLLVDLDDDWPRLHQVSLTRTLIQRAANFTERFALRAYDAIQLAAAQAVHEQVGDSEAVYFGCFDDRLTAAAGRLGLRTL